MTPDDWGPLTGPWKRHDSDALTTGEGIEILSGQNACQGVFEYRGRWRLLLQSYDGAQHTRLTSSDDGLAWDEPQSVLRPEEAWEGDYALGNAVRVEDEEVWLYYFGKVGIQERIGLARSADLVAWRRHPGNPVFSPSDSSRPAERVFPDSAVRHEDRVFLFYDAGFGYQHPEHPRAYTIWAAAGHDGLSFADVVPHPVLGPGDEGSWDDAWVCQAHVIEIEGWWYMLYVGMSSGRDNKDGQAFGLARAPHPAGPWEKYPGNPVFSPAGREAWDGLFLQHPCPVRCGDEWRLYYTGHGITTGYAVGLAVPE